jgi:hypothetical protein
MFSSVAVRFSWRAGKKILAVESVTDLQRELLSLEVSE